MSAATNHESANKFSARLSDLGPGYRNCSEVSKIMFVVPELCFGKVNLFSEESRLILTIDFVSRCLKGLS